MPLVFRRVKTSHLNTSTSQYYIRRCEGSHPSFITYVFCCDIFNQFMHIRIYAFHFHILCTRCPMSNSKVTSDQATVSSTSPVGSTVHHYQRCPNEQLFAINSDPEEEPLDLSSGDRKEEPLDLSTIRTDPDTQPFSTIIDWQVVTLSNSTYHSKFQHVSFILWLTQNNTWTRIWCVSLPTSYRQCYTITANSKVDGG